MPRGIEHEPKTEMKLTAITFSCNGQKLQKFLMLPVISGKSVIPPTLYNRLLIELGAGIGDTITVG